MEEKATDWIVIDGGDTFEGTRQQFEECFIVPDSTNQTIAETCAYALDGSKFEIFDRQGGNVIDSSDNWETPNKTDDWVNWVEV